MPEGAHIEVKLSRTWRELQGLLQPYGLARRMNTQMKRATKVNGRMLRREIRATIREGLKPKKSRLTLELHPGESLMDNGDLWKAVESKVIDVFSAEVGIPKGHEVAERAIVIHGGQKIKVTAKMRNLFKLLYYVSNGDMPAGRLEGRAAELWKQKPGGWLPLSRNTTHIIVPPRPFIQDTLNKPIVRRIAGRNWLDAWVAALAGRRAKLSTR